MEKAFSERGLDHTVDLNDCVNEALIRPRWDSRHSLEANNSLGSCDVFVASVVSFVAHQTVRAGTGRGDFLAALEDRVKAEETQWAPLLQLHFPDLLDGYLNKVLVETEQRFFKKEPMDAPGSADLAARRRELLKNRLVAKKDIGEDRLQGREGLGSSEELVQRVRAAEEQLARTSAALKAIRCRLRRRRQFFCEEELRLAWKRRDVAATFRWSRLLGGRRWGGQKEGLQGVVGSTPLEKGVEGRVDQAGSRRRHGGVGSRKLVGLEAQTPDLLKRSEIKAEVVGEARKDMEELMSSFRTVKKRRACPAGSPPAGMWTMLLHTSRNLSLGGQGSGYQRKKIEPVFTLSLMETLLCRVRSSGTVPLAWHHSSGAPLQKNNKAGPKGKRVVHVLPSVGKQFFKVLLRTKRDMWSPPAPADWLHGYIPGRRRESAVFIRQVTT